MAIDQDKIKATDYLIESIKLIVVVVTIFMTGLLTFHEQVNETNIYFFYSSILFFAITLIISILNLNVLINKVYRSEEDAIKQKDTKNCFIYLLLALIIGIISAGIFLYCVSNSNMKITINTGQISIMNDEIVIDSNFTNKVKILKFYDGTIKEVIIN